MYQPWAVVLAQLVERLLLTPDVRGSNPIVGENVSTYVSCFIKFLHSKCTFLNTQMYAVIKSQCKR